MESPSHSRKTQGSNPSQWTSTSPNTFEQHDTQFQIFGPTMELSQHSEHKEKQQRQDTSCSPISSSPNNSSWTPSVLEAKRDGVSISLPKDPLENQKGLLPIQTTDSPTISSITAGFQSPDQKKNNIRLLDSSQPSTLRTILEGLASLALTPEVEEWPEGTTRSTLQGWPSSRYQPRSSTGPAQSLLVLEGGT